MDTLGSFNDLDLRVGVVLSAEPNAEARVDAYVLTIDFGELGVKTSSAQITEHYEPEDLVGRQVVAITNLPPKTVAGVRSEVLVLASTGPDGTVLLSPDRPVANGSRIA